MFGMGTGVSSLSYPPERLRELNAPSGLHKGKIGTVRRRDGAKAMDKSIKDSTSRCIRDRLKNLNLITCGQALDLLVPVS